MSGRLFWLDLRPLHGLDVHQLAAVAQHADELEARYEEREREAIAQVFGVIALGSRSLIQRPAPGRHGGVIHHDPTAPTLHRVDDLGTVIAGIQGLLRDANLPAPVRDAWSGLMASVETELRRRQRD